MDDDAKCKALVEGFTKLKSQRNPFVESAMKKSVKEAVEYSDIAAHCSGSLSVPTVRNKMLPTTATALLDRVSAVPDAASPIVDERNLKSEEVVAKRSTHESWDGENLQELLDDMDSNPQIWKICDADLLPIVKNPNKQKCFNCCSFGHTKAKCPEAPKPPACYMCGRLGHRVHRCPRSICLRCSKPNNLYTRSCCRCPDFENMMCYKCKRPGHTSRFCTENWRKYLGMTTENVGRNNFVKFKKVQNCSNCGEKGHLSENCDSSPINEHTEVFDSVKSDKSYDTAADECSNWNLSEGKVEPNTNCSGIPTKKARLGILNTDELTDKEKKGNTSTIETAPTSTGPEGNKIAEHNSVDENIKIDQQEMEIYQLVPKHVSALIVFLQNNLKLLLTYLGDVNQLWYRLESLQYSSSTSAIRNKNISKVIRILNMILIGQAGLMDGRENLRVLLIGLKNLMEAPDTLKIVPKLVRASIDEHCRPIFSSCRRGNYSELIKQYTQLKIKNKLPRLHIDSRLLMPKSLETCGENEYNEHSQTVNEYCESTQKVNSTNDLRGRTDVFPANSNTSNVSGKTQSDGNRLLAAIEKPKSLK